MLSSRLLSVLIAVVCVCMSVLPSSTAFAPVPPSKTTRDAAFRHPSFLSAKKPQEDLSYIESRDMTREEMQRLNARNEEIMNMELSMMTGFSLVISLPILYLCWVAFFSD